jgi:lysophospholipase L1-like esterase
MIKNKWKLLLIIVRNVAIILLVLEISIGAYSSLKTDYAQNIKINALANSRLYPDLKKDTVKQMISELYQQNMKWSSYTHYSFKAFEGVHNNIDKLGQRNTLNFTTNTTEKPYRIFGFGGSTLYGSGARDNYTIPSELSKLIKKNHPYKQVEITNFGCHGYIRSMENMALQKELLKGNIPDLVLFYDGVNDVVSALQNNQAGLPTNSANRENEFNIGISYKSRLRSLLTKSNLYQFIKTHTKTNAIDQKTAKTLSEEIVTNYLGNVKISKAISQAYNFEVLNFIQPAIYTKNNKIGIEKQALEETKVYENIFNMTYNTLLKTDTSANDLIDISTVFSESDKPLYLDFCHINETGNETVAKSIYGVINERIFKADENEN